MMKIKKDRLQLMVTMLLEVSQRKWKPTENRETLPDRYNIAGPHRFNLFRWIGPTLTSGGQCGFVACAVGHACLDDRFISQGFSFVGTSPSLKEGRKEIRGWDAVCAFFGLTQHQAERLFSQSNYTGKPSALKVVERIQSLLVSEN